MNFDLTAIFLGIFQGRKSNKLKNWKIKFWLQTEIIYLQNFELQTRIKLIPRKFVTCGSAKCI